MALCPMALDPMQFDSDGVATDVHLTLCFIF